MDPDGACMPRFPSFEGINFCLWWNVMTRDGQSFRFPAKKCLMQLVCLLRDENMRKLDCSWLFSETDTVAYDSWYFYVLVSIKVYKMCLSLATKGDSQQGWYTSPNTWLQHHYSGYPRMMMSKFLVWNGVDLSFLFSCQWLPFSSIETSAIIVGGSYLFILAQSFCLQFANPTPSLQNPHAMGAMWKLLMCLVVTAVSLRPEPLGRDMCQQTIYKWQVT